MHNPYAKAGGFQNEAPELKLADGLDLKSAFAKQHMTAKAVLGNVNVASMRRCLRAVSGCAAFLGVGLIALALHMS